MKSKNSPLDLDAICLIGLPLVGRQGDFFGSIPAIPTAIPLIAAYLAERKIRVEVIDAFGLAPWQVTSVSGKIIRHGLDLPEVVDRIPASAKVIGISVHSGMEHSAALELGMLIKKRTPEVIVVAGGNHPTAVYREFLDAGFDYVVLSEGEESFYELIGHLRGDLSRDELDGVAGRDWMRPKTRFLDSCDLKEFPAYDKLPLRNYWDLGYSHAPFQGAYLPLITSRGCPFDCRFCTTPQTYQRKWRARSPENVVAEVEYFYRKLGVRNFQIQDENFIVDKSRVRRFCELMVATALPVQLTLPSGVRAEMLDSETIECLAKAGVKYLCIAPESGSEKILERIHKQYSFDKFFEAVRRIRNCQIQMGAFLIVGLPGETILDFLKTLGMLVKLTWMGVAEFSIFIFSPLPGSGLYNESPQYAPDHEGLCWSPSWRKDYGVCLAKRYLLYGIYFVLRLIRHPVAVLRSIRNIIRGTFELKHEMVFHRLLFGRRPGYPSKKRFEKTIDLYHEIGMNFIDFNRLKLRFQLLPFDEIECAIPKTGRVLDLGCGHGFFTFYLADGFPERHVTGIDIDDRKINLAKKALGKYSGKNAEVSQEELSGFSNRSFDCVLINDVLYLQPLEKQKEILRQCYRILKEGGLLAIKTVSKKPFLKFAYVYLMEVFAVKVFNYSKGEGLFFDKIEKISKMLTNAGFEVRQKDLSKKRLYPGWLFVGLKTAIMSKDGRGG